MIGSIALAAAGGAAGRRARRRARRRRARRATQRGGEAGSAAGRRREAAGPVLDGSGQGFLEIAEDAGFVVGMKPARGLVLLEPRHLLFGIDAGVAAYLL